MGYFDALAASSFKTGQDGRRLFFPYGTLGPGLVIRGETEYRRLRRRLTINLMVALSLGWTAVGLGGLWGGGVILPVLILPYVFWAAVQCRRMERTDERVTLGEAWRVQDGDDDEHERKMSHLEGIPPGA